MELMTIFRKEILGVKAVVINNRNDEVLLVKHSYKGRNKWYLPGGGVWYKERPDNAIKRELGEEVGLKIKDIKLVGIYRGRNNSLTFLFVSNIDPDLVNLNPKQFEIEEASFFNVKKLPKNICVGVRDRINDAKIFLRTKNRAVLWSRW